MDDYKREVGRRLRAVRHMQGLTLADVEDRSDGEWKAVVVGSYERGDRGISVPRLSSLAAFYGVPLAPLLPTGERDRDGPAVLTLRGEDLRTVAAAIGVDQDRFLDDLRSAGLVAERSFTGITAVRPHARAQ